VRQAPALPLLLLLCLGAASASPDADPGLPPGLTPETPVHLSADELIREPSGIVEAKGRVRVSAGPLFLGADSIRYDPETQRAELSGSVTLVDGKYVARAASASVDLQAQTGVLTDVALFQKMSPPDLEALLDATDPIEVRKTGRNELEVHAETVVRLEDGSYTATAPSVTTCDCGDRPPDWRLAASSARLSPEDRLRLTWPVLYARDVPVLASPFLSLPLTNERKSGLLFAVPHITGRRGPSYEQPVYIVLGHSYDMTLSAGYYFGHAVSVTSESGPRPDDGAPLEEDPFRGPRGSIEFRYAPRIGTAGRAFFSYGYDLSKRGGLVPGADPSRFGIQVDHADDWDGPLSDRLSVNLVSDRNYIRDFVDDIVLRGEETLRSTAWIAWRQGAALAEVDGIVQQDLRPAFGPDTPVPVDFGETLRLFGEGARNTFQRVPSASVNLARMQGPFGTGLSLHLGVVRFEPWTTTGFGDLGVDGLGPGDPGYPGPDLGEDDGRFQDGEFPSADRLSIRPTLSLPIVAGRWLSLTPYGGWREQVYRFGQDQGTGAVGWAVAGAAAHTEIARTFSGGARHSWIPRLELRALLPSHADDPPPTIYDERDIRPLRATTQARAGLGTQLHTPGPGGGVLALEAEVAQDATLTPDPRLVETIASASVSLWPFRLGGLAVWDPFLDELSETVGEASITDLRGDQLRLSYRKLGPAGSARLRAGPDELFSDRFVTEVEPPIVLDDLEQIGAGVTLVPIQRLSLTYDFLFLPDLSSAKLLQQRASVGYRSGCDCWAGALHFAKRRHEGIDFWVSFNLGRI